MSEVLALPAFHDNYIWVLRDGAGVANVAIVDPGDASPVLDYLARSGDRLHAILLTHHHSDHIGGVAEIVARHPVPVFGPAMDAAACVDHPVVDGDRIGVPGLSAKLDVLAVPGHTLTHVAYHDTAAGRLFCGDTLFAAGCGRLFEGTPAQMRASLERLNRLPAATAIYCAHEYTASNLRFAAAVEPDNPAVRRRIAEVTALRAAGRATIPTRLDLERETNPFLRWETEAVRRAAAARLGRAPADATETFAVIREWKNAF